VKVRYSEGVAIHTDPESCAGHCREAVREALTGGRIGEVWSGESNAVRGADFPATPPAAPANGSLAVSFQAIPLIRCLRLISYHTRCRTTRVT
jgi:hypothetical protein